MKKVIILFFSFILLSNLNSSLSYNKDNIETMVEISPKLDVYSRQYFMIGNTKNKRKSVFDISGWVILHKNGNSTYVNDFNIVTNIIK